MSKLPESTGYIEPASDFYSRQEIHLENSDEFNKMGALYNGRLNKILEKGYEDQSGKNAGERLLKQVIRDGNKIQFGEYLKYLIENGKISNNHDYDDIDQIGELRDNLGSLREEVENNGNRDFSIVKGIMNGLPLKTSDFKYLGNNIHSVEINFEKIKAKKINKVISLRKTYSDSDKLLIKYDGIQEIKFYIGESRYDINNKNLISTKFVGDKSIDISNIRKRGRNTEVRSRQEGAKIPVVLDELNMKLLLQFSVN